MLKTLTTTPARCALAGLVVAALVALQPAPVRAAEVQKVVSDQGITAWLVEDHSNPILSLRMAFRGGAALDPEDKPGLANLVASTIDEGAGEMSSQDFQQALSQKAIKLSFDASLDAFYGSLKTLSENRARAFELMALALTQPRFDAEPVQRIKSQIQASLARRSQDPRSVANLTLDKLMFPDHPYGQPTSGTQASLQRITRQDLHDFVETRFARDRLMVGVVGDITPEELKPLLDRAFADLPETTGDVPQVTDVAPKGAGETVVVEKSVPQSWVVLGHDGIARDDPDYYAASLVNYVLGGGQFASRLFTEVREKRGLVYSVYSYLHPLDHASVMGGGLGTGNASVGKALEVVRQEWRRMAEEGPTQEELADAKTYMTGSFPLRLSSTSNIASILVAMQQENLGMDYMDKRKQLIESVTLDQAKRVAGELLHPDDLAVVVVGQPEGVEPTREAPQIGDGAS
ncbi:M16 family metallopeptidase [Rhodovibrio salinarum]|uniref:Insulinase family protein n=1 Tax=Rhodovibrio salinarum TaxID=1087 RepID=A0A934V3A2_9PROT|nr:pitrilysin family protein [Rhodovibrio salinarum]MBK1699194.1 insulinase family protein [Rhodovibrio salinarum]